MASRGPRNGPMISFGNFGTGKFLYEWRSHKYRNSKFSMNHERYIANPPMNGLAGLVKNNFSKSSKAARSKLQFRDQTPKRRKFGIKLQI